MTYSSGGAGHSAPERVLFVHAHPDDESISTGGTIATLIERGSHVTVLTCTRGERGEVIPADLRHLDGAPAALGHHRENELRRALDVLGVTDHRYLGAQGARWTGRPPRRYLDSGMQWGDGEAVPLALLDPASLAAADFAEVATDIASVIAAVEPTVVVSYDEHGGYGHPDHVRAHHAARRAAEVMGVPFYAIDSQAEPGAASVRIDVSGVMARKKAALAAHRSQIIVDGDTFALSSGGPRRIETTEAFQRVYRDSPSIVQPYRDQTWLVRSITAIVAFVVGAAIGAMLTVSHQTTIDIIIASVPIGLIAGILIIASLLIGLRLVFETRVVPGAAAVGVLLAIAVLSAESAGGSILVPAVASGWVWTFGPALVALLVLAWPNLRDASGARPRGKLEARQ